MDRKTFIKHLENRNLFWSYAKGNTDEWPDRVVIETVLMYGSTEDIIQLFKLYDKRLIRNVWQTALIPDSRHLRLNTYLAKIFFNINNPTKYFAKHSRNNRYERIKQLASSN